MSNVAILDDYQQVALGSANWSPVSDRFSLDVVTEHLQGDRLVERLQESEIIVAMRERTAFPRSLLSRLPALRLLVTTGMSNASIDVQAADDLGVTVCGTASGSTTSVPELTFGMILALTRRLVAEHDAMRSGGWQHTVGRGLAGNTLGIVGLGRIGTAVAELAKAFQMNVLAWSPHLTPQRAAEHGAQAVSKEALFENSDVVTVHLRLTDETRGVIGAAEIASMRQTAFLVNTSRGPLIDEKAMITALRTRSIAGAGLDVYDSEPLPSDHVLRGLPGVLLLPHIGYVTEEVYRVFFPEAVEDIVAYLAGEPLRVLRP